MSDLVSDLFFILTVFLLTRNKCPGNAFLGIKNGLQRTLVKFSSIKDKLLPCMAPTWLQHDPNMTPQKACSSGYRNGFQMNIRHKPNMSHVGKSKGNFPHSFGFVLLFQPVFLDLQQVSWKTFLGGPKRAAKDTC